MSEPRTGMVAGKPIITGALTRDYEAGYERAFGSEQRERREGRARYVWDDKSQKLVPVASDWQPTTRRVPVVGDSHYDGLRTSEGVDVSSRTKHRRYMKENGVTLASDFTETWTRAEQERANPKRDPHLREQLGRALYEAEKRRR